METSKLENIINSIDAKDIGLDSIDVMEEMIEEAYDEESDLEAIAVKGRQMLIEKLLHHHLHHAENIAAAVGAAVGMDGTRFTVCRRGSYVDGIKLEDIAKAAGGVPDYADKVWDEEEDDYKLYFIDCSSVTTSSLVRYEFSDGSAIVESGGAWDFEGNEPFSWRG